MQFAEKISWAQCVKTQKERHVFSNQKHIAIGLNVYSRTGNIRCTHFTRRITVQI